MLPQPLASLLDEWVTVGRRPQPLSAGSTLLPTPIYHPSWPPGGRQSKYAVNAFEVFDIESRSWTKFPNIPCKRAFSSFVTLDSHLYSLGGLRQGRLYRQPKFLRTMDVFDMEQGELGTSLLLALAGLWLLSSLPTGPSCPHPILLLRVTYPAPHSTHGYSWGQILCSVQGFLLPGWF